MNVIAPYDLDAEESLLGAMLLSRNAIVAASDSCTAEDFYKPAHGHIFSAILSLYARAEPADPVTVADELRRSGLLDAVGDASVLISLQVNTPSTANALHYAQIVQERGHARRVQFAGLGLAHAISDGGPVAELMDKFADVVGQGIWPEPIPLDRSATLSGFPVEVLPDSLAAFVGAVARMTATPVDLAGIAALGALAIVTSGAAQVELADDWRVPLNLYAAVILAPGEGKTPVFQKVGAPLYAIERDRRARAAPAIAEAESVQRIAETRRAQLEKDAARAFGETRMEAEEAARVAAVEAAALLVPQAPRLVTNEATPEGLVKLAASNRGSVGIWADEGGEVFEIAARYSTNGKANLGAYLQGHDGQAYTSDRSGREALSVERLTLSMVLALQPCVLDEVAKDRANRERGLLARLVWAMPTSAVGQRATERPRVPEQLTQEWCALLTSVADQAETAEEPVTLTLTPAAAGMFRRWHEEHEPRLHPDTGDLRDVVDWGNKLPGQVGRLAGLLHVASERGMHGNVDVEAMSGALRLADYFAEHALAVFGAMNENPAVPVALKVLRWLRKYGTKQFTEREAQQHAKGGRVKSKADLEPGLELLADLGFVRPEYTQGPPRPGRPPSRRYQVNPAIHRGATPITPRSPEGPSNGGNGGSSEAMPALVENEEVDTWMG